MISWRYHLISIVAIFLALALGVLAGSTVIKQDLIDTLKAQTAQAKSQSDKLEAQNAEFSAELGALLPQALADQLAGAQVLVVTPNNVDPAALGQARSALDDSGATILATLKVNLQNVDNSALSAALGLPASSSTAQLSIRAAHLLAARLADGTTSQPKDDLLYQILQSGLLVPDGNFRTTSVGGSELRVIVVGPTDAGGSVPPPSDFIDPFARDLVSLQVPVAVGSSAEAAPSFLTPIRQSTSGQLVTVNDLETPIGGAALVFGMARLITSHKGGDYGVGSGTSLLPPTPSPTP